MRAFSFSELVSRTQAIKSSCHNIKPPLQGSP
jgi:hypothetical protein